ncbi:MAG: MaoC/PaaZ C-terminal domain-containing protein [Nitriliruptoraceae bacterium]
MSALEVGTEAEPVVAHADLASSVRYAGASGDLNPLHFDAETAREVSPTGRIIAHGMYSMGLASRMLTALAGGPERVLELQVRFTRPWPLGTTSTFTGKVTAVADGVATVAVVGTNAETGRILRGTGKVRV